MILLPALIVFSGFLISIAIRHLGQSFGSYYDFVAMVMVIGGTLIVGAVLLPWEYRKDIRYAFRSLLRPEKNQYKIVMSDILKSLQSGMLPSGLKQEFLYQKILKDGLEMIQLGFSKEKLEEVLSERVFHSAKRWKKVSNSVKSLAKYPPAFGLMGTVFGLVNIMKSLASASEASQLGVEMSIALVATMYGLLVANFVVNPIGEILSKKAEEEEEYASLAFEAVLLIKSESPLLESVELLNSLVPESDRIHFEQLSGQSNDGVAA